MNIVLVGYRGSGKSTVAGLLAAATGMPHACLDDEIVSRAGSSIPEIVQALGWEGFRDLESAVVRDYSERDGWILDAGGGVILRQENVRLLRGRGLLVWLQAPPAVLTERIRDDTQRPALKVGKTFLEEIEEVLEERGPLYRAAAHHAIDTADLTPEQVCLQILDAIKSRRSGNPG